MNIGWVLADATVLDPTQDLTQLKNIGSFWGSWRTWRACATDNVICHDMKQAETLLKRQFQKQCNFYMPNDIYTALNRPVGVKLYEGKFMHDIDRQEEIVAMHLAASTSDIVLLLGFDLNKLVTDPDRLRANQAQHHRNLIRQVIKDNAQIQWVVVDHLGVIDPNLTNLGNIVTDTMDAVLALAGD
jgi:hypothetical protein